MSKYIISGIAAFNFNHNKAWKCGNTEVKVFPSEVSLRLFGNEIAFKHTSEPNKVFINFKGYRTRTTVDRLEAVTDLQFSIAKDKLRYRQYTVDDWVEINSLEWYQLVEKDGKKWLELSKQQ